MDHRHHLVRDAELVGDELGEGGLVPLAVGGRAREHGDAPVVGHHHVGDLLVLEAADLHVRGRADADQPALPARRLLLAAERLVPCRLERVVQRPGVVAAVVDVAEDGVVREAVGGDEVPAAHLGRVEAEAGGEHLDPALDEVGGLRASRAAVRHRAHGVGEGADDLDARRLDVVAAGDHLRAEEREQHAHVVEAGAHVADDLHVQRHDAAARVGGQAQVRAHVAAVPRGLDVLAACRAPAHRALEPAREEGHEGVLLVDGDLGAEAAAHAPRHQVDLPGLEMEPLGDLVPHPVRGLGVAPYCELLRALVPDGAARPGLHGEGNHALADHLRLDDHRRPREGAVHVALLPLEAHGDIGARLRIEEGSAGLERALRVPHGGERLVVDLDGLGRIRGGLGALGRHHRHRLAHVAQPPLGEHRVALQAHEVEHLRRDRRVDHTDLRVDVGAGQHGHDAREGAGGPGVDAREHGVRVGTPDEGEGQRALEAHVVDIGIAAGDELRVLEPLERTADVLDRHDVPLPGTEVAASRNRGAGAPGVLTGGHGTTAGGGQKRRQWPAAGSGATRSIPPGRARR